MAGRVEKPMNSKERLLQAIEEKQADWTERFLRWIHYDADNNRLIWIGPKSRKGYGFISINGQGYAAHRVMYQLIHGPIPEGQFVLHRNDVPDDVTPDNLYLGNHADNARDRVRNGKQSCGLEHARKVSEKRWGHPKSSPFLGVTVTKKGFAASVFVNTTLFNLGTYPSESDAALIVDLALVASGKREPVNRFLPEFKNQKRRWRKRKSRRSDPS